jgi:integrase
MPNGKTQRAAKALSAAMVRTVQKPGKYHDGGGTGLYLRVDPNGARFWVQRLTIRGKRREMGLGSPPLITLAEVRDKASDNKRLARAGGDPLAEKPTARGTLTFAEAVEHYLEGKLAEFRNDKHRKQWRATLDTYAAPKIGKMQVEGIEVRDVLRVLEPIWTTKTETASRLRGRIEAVLSWATVAGHRDGDNPARWGGNLAELLPKPSKVTKGGNHPALALGDVTRWWRELSKREGMAARALEFLTMCAARSGEVRGMTWGEVDLGGGHRATRATLATWTIPADRMKAEREHRVPLTPEAIALLQSVGDTGEGVDWRKPDDDALVFPAPRGGTMSDMTISAVMRRMNEANMKSGDVGWIDSRSKRPAVPHGLRSTFRDWAAEAGYERDMAEMALAHNVGTAVERAYRRTDYLERRRMMQSRWISFLNETKIDLN